MSATEKLVDASRSGDLELVSELLGAGVSPEARDADGSTALYAAAVQGNAAVVNELLAAGANPGIQSSAEAEGAPLCAAAAWGSTDVVLSLLAAGADPNIRETAGMTPLLYASSHGFTDVVRALLDKGADPDQASEAGETPLLAAVRRGSLKVVRLLVDAGADLAVHDSVGRTASELADGLDGTAIEETLLGEVAGTDSDVRVASVHRSRRADGVEVVQVAISTSGDGTLVIERELDQREIADYLRQHRRDLP